MLFLFKNYNYFFIGKTQENPFISYLRAIRELHSVSIMSNFTEHDWKQALFDFEENFFFLYNIYKLNMTQDSYHFPPLPFLFQ